MRNKKKPIQFCVCGRNIIYARHLIAQARAIRGRLDWEIKGAIKVPDEKQPWHNWGECCGGPSAGDDIDGVGSWGPAVRAFEDRDNERTP